MSTRVFIDGAEGTTGLRLAERLSRRGDIEFVSIPSELRKDAAERARLSNSADVVFLCLPDAAAKEAVEGITNPNVKVIDASTAHRVDDNWVYGLPELSAAHREAVTEAKKLSVPGCYPTGFILLAQPLVSAGIAPDDYPFTCHAMTGYSGGGKKMIAEYGDTNRGREYSTPRQYALGQTHKHLPEMKKLAKLGYSPAFNPIVCDFYSGMAVTVPLHARLLSRKMSLNELHAFYEERYRGQNAVKVMPLGAESAFTGSMIDAQALSGRDILEIYVCGNDDNAVLVALFDNLGKGASGAAVQCMNIMLGLDEMTGLVL